jgi:hypothetical protein
MSKDEEWQSGKQKPALLLNGGSKRNGRMYARGSRVADARVRNGVLHIVAPARGFLVKHPKHPKR